MSAVPSDGRARRSDAPPNATRARPWLRSRTTCSSPAWRSPLRRRCVGRLAHERDGMARAGRLRRVRGGRAAVRRRHAAPRSARRGDALVPRDGGLPPADRNPGRAAARRRSPRSSSTCPSGCGSARRGTSRRSTSSTTRSRSSRRSGSTAGSPRRTRIPTPGLRTAIAGIAACVVFVVVNHTLLATMFRLGRGIAVAGLGAVRHRIALWQSWCSPRSASASPPSGTRTRG